MAGIFLAILKDQEGSQYGFMNDEEGREDEVGGAVGSRILQASQRASCNCTCAVRELSRWVPFLGPFVQSRPFLLHGVDSEL